MKNRFGGMINVALVFAVIGLVPSIVRGSADLYIDAAKKVALTRTNVDCLGNSIPPVFDEPFGFAIINRAASGKIIANVVLQHGTPSAVYSVRVIQTPSGADCPTIDGTLTTDDDGNGNVNIQEAVAPGATGAFVVLNNQLNFSGDFFTTQKATF